MTKRRGNGEGSVYRRRNGRYVGEYTDDKGKRRYVSGSSKADVRAKLRDALASKGEPAPCMPTNLTVAEFLGQYEEAAKDTMKQRSFETYRDIKRKHLLPAFGAMKLKDLTREHVQRLYSRKREQGLSAARVRRIHGVFLLP